MKNTKKIMAIFIVAIMLLCSFIGIVNAAENNETFFTEENIKTIIEAKDMTSTKFSPQFLLTVYCSDSVMGVPALSNILVEDFAEKDLNKEGIIRLTFEDEKGTNGDIDSDDAGFILQIAHNTYKLDEDTYHINALKQDIMKKYNIKSDDIEIVSTIEVPDTIFEITREHFEVDLDDVKIFGGKSNSIEVSSKTTTEAQMNQIWEDMKSFVYSFEEKNENETPENKYFVLSTKVKANIGNDVITYTLTLGKDQDWYLVPDKMQEDKEFSTEISYLALIDGKDVGQNTKYKEENKIASSVFCPGFDEKQPAKDADVTVTIKSKTDLPILQTNGVPVKEDGKANSEGWYYVDVNNKKVVAKVYKFEDYKNLKDNGKVTENVILASENDLSDEQKVAITWPFRIIDVKYDPTEITEKTEKVTVTITTNLPIDKEKLPDGWKFTTDDEGTEQRRVSKVYEKKDGKNIDEIVTLKQNGTDVTASTPVEIAWKEKLSPKMPQTGGTLTVAAAIVILTICSVVAFKKYKK